MEDTREGGGGRISVLSGCLSGCSFTDMDKKTIDVEMRKASILFFSKAVNI